MQPNFTRVEGVDIVMQSNSSSVSGISGSNKFRSSFDSNARTMSLIRGSCDYGGVPMRNFRLTFIILATVFLAFGIVELGRALHDFDRNYFWTPTTRQEPLEKG